MPTPSVSENPPCFTVAQKAALVFCAGTSIGAALNHCCPVEDLDSRVSNAVMGLSFGMASSVELVLRSDETVKRKKCYIALIAMTSAALLAASIAIVRLTEP